MRAAASASAAARGVRHARTPAAMPFGDGRTAFSRWSCSEPCDLGHTAGAAHWGLARQRQEIAMRGGKARDHHAARSTPAVGKVAGREAAVAPHPALAAVAQRAARAPASLSAADVLVLQ